MQELQYIIHPVQLIDSNNSVVLPDIYRKIIGK